MWWSSCEQTDRQTDRHTHYNTSHPSWGKINIHVMQMCSDIRQTMIDVEAVEAQCTTNGSGPFITTKLLSQRHRPWPRVTALHLRHNLVGHDDLRPGLNHVSVDLHNEARRQVGDCEILAGARMTATATHTAKFFPVILLWAYTPPKQTCPWPQQAYINFQASSGQRLKH